MLLLKITETNTTTHLNPLDRNPFPYLHQHKFEIHHASLSKSFRIHSSSQMAMLRTKVHWKFLVF